MHLFIATPVMSGPTTAYSNSLFAADKFLRARGIEWTGGFMSGTWVTSQRNDLCQLFLESKATHLLFIDSDMKWTESDLDRLLKHGEDVSLIGAFYPKKELDWSAVKNVKDPRDPEEVRRAVSRQTWGHFEIGDRVEKEGAGARVQVDFLPTGFMLIERSVLTRLRLATGNQLAYKSFSLDREGCYLYFDYPLVGETLISEDVAFSQMCREFGIELWELCDVELGHVGTVTF